MRIAWENAEDGKGVSTKWFFRSLWNDLNSTPFQAEENQEIMPTR